MVLQVDIPAEPEDGSVVLDRNARAWQRLGEHWYPASGPERMRAHAVRWAYLLVDLGPLARMVAESAIEEFIASDFSIPRRLILGSLPSSPPFDRPAGGWTPPGWQSAGYVSPECETFAQDADAEPTSVDLETPSFSPTTAPSFEDLGLGPIAVADTSTAQVSAGPDGPLEATTAVVPLGDLEAPPRTWRGGDSEPEGVAEVEDADGDVWYRDPDGRWSSPLGIIPRVWSVLLDDYAPLTERRPSTAQASA